MSKAKDLKDALLSAAAKKMFPPDSQGKKVDEELRDIADGKDTKDGGDRRG